MTMWAAVIGSPIAHSLSPVIHRAAWQQLGIDGWEYRRAEVTEESLPTFIGQLDESFRGLSVTMPCTQAIMPLLHAIVPLASAVGAVNTVVPSAGMLAGFNTDVTGIASAIRRACSRSGVPVPSSALVLGARATASSALAALGPTFRWSRLCYLRSLTPRRERRAGHVVRCLCGSECCRPRRRADLDAARGRCRCHSEPSGTPRGPDSPGRHLLAA